VAGTITNGAATENIQQWGFYLYKKQSDGTYSQVLDAFNNASGTFPSGSYSCTLNSTPASGTYSMYIDNLEPGATYKFKAEIKTDVQGWISAPSMSGEYTMYSAPSVSTTSATYSGSGQSHTFTGSLNSLGNPSCTEWGLLIGSNSTPTFSNSTKYYWSNPSSTGSNSKSINLLWSGNTYYYRFYAINSVDTVYGTIKSITSPSAPTSVGFVNGYDSPYYYSTNITQNSIKLMTSGSTGTAPLTGRGLVYTTSSSVAGTTPTSSNVSTSSSDVSSKWVKVEGTTSSVIVIISGLSSNTTYYVKSYNTNAYGTTYSSTTKTIKTALNCGQTLTDQNGNTYATVKIGSQCWMKSNLKATNYDNVLAWSTSGTGTSITHVSTGSSSNMSTTAPRRYYPNGVSGNVSTYGYMYNWPGATGYGVNNSNTGSNMNTNQGKNQGICPRGWHIPTQAEMSTLNSALNTTSNWSAFSPEYAGYVSSSSGNTSGFSSRMEIWSTTLNSGSNYYYMYMTSSLTHNVTSESAATGKSVRCVQDIAY
jgi:uncharacterized protein (TIGR02145 family)